MLRLLRRKKDSPEQALRRALADVELPSFPAVVAQALALIGDSQVDNKRIAETVAQDPGLSVKLLGTVNSAAFAVRHQVRSVEHAVSLLGRAQLESLLISVAVREALPRQQVDGFDTRRFWTTAAGRATVARSFASRIDPVHASECFTAGLLLDMALPVLCLHQDAYRSALQAWHEGDEDLAQLERNRFGWDHALAAAWMCDSWKLPDVLKNAITAHHGSETGADQPLPAASLVAPMREVNPEIGTDRVLEAAIAEHGIGRDEAATWLQEGLEQAQSVASLFT